MKTCKRYRDSISPKCFIAIKCCERCMVRCISKKAPRNSKKPFRKDFLRFTDKNHYVNSIWFFLSGSWFRSLPFFEGTANNENIPPGKIPRFCLCRTLRSMKNPRAISLQLSEFFVPFSKNKQTDKTIGFRKPLILENFPCLSVCFFFKSFKDFRCR